MKPAHSPDPFITLLLVDDHAIVRSGVSALLSNEPDFRLLGAAANETEAIEQFRSLRPRIMLVDLQLGGPGGIFVIEEIRKIDPNARLIVLTSYSGDEDIHRALAAGACGYVLKDATGGELADAIRTVHGGDDYIPGTVASRLARRSKFGELSERELEVLQQIVKGRSNKEIASALGCTEVTVKFHVSNILVKLGADDRTGAAVQAIQRGIIKLP